MHHYHLVCKGTPNTSTAVALISHAPSPGPDAVKATAASVQNYLLSGQVHAFPTRAKASAADRARPPVYKQGHDVQEDNSMGSSFILGSASSAQKT